MQFVRSNPLVVIVGPTGVGKTELAIVIAKKLKGEIVSADSRLLYRGMDIGTAKPPIQDRKLVPHHLIDIVDPDQRISLPVYKELATQAIASIHQKDKLPIVVGGTGQYIWALLEGWSPPLTPSDHLREVLTRIGLEKGSSRLYKILLSIDKKAAQKIDANNLRRIVRALEVIITTGKKFSAQRKKNPPNYHAKIIGLNRTRGSLYRRIDARIESMIETGFIEEVNQLLVQGYSPKLPSMSAIGYKEIALYLDKKLSFEEVIAQMKRGTRRFIRHQNNWFKSDDPRIHWFAAEKKETIMNIIEFISNEKGWINLEHEKK